MLGYITLVMFQSDFYHILTQMEMLNEVLMTGRGERHMSVRVHLRMLPHDFKEQMYDNEHQYNSLCVGNSIYLTLRKQKILVMFSWLVR